MLLGRNDELAQVRALVEGVAHGRGGALLLHGPAGIGKTALLDGAGHMAQDATVLVSRGIESESSLSFGALRDLLAPLADVLPVLPAPQRDALAGAIAMGPPAPGDRLAVCVATLGLLEAAAVRTPLLAVVDDVQWLDPASRECVSYAARRARGRLAFLLARRDSSGDDGWERIPSVRLGPLDRAAAAELLGAVAPDLAPEAIRAVAEAADGNPLALVELPGTLTPAQRQGREPLEQPLPPAEGLERVYAGRVAELPEEAAVALLVAAASHTHDAAPIIAALPALGGSAAGLQAAEAAGLVRVAPGTVTFAHPLVRGAVYHGAPAARRRAAHRALADVTDGEARAWHLAGAAAGADEAAARALEQAAGVATARRAYAVAADGLERAARLSEDGGACAARLLGAGVAALSAGRAARATALAEEARRRATAPQARAGAEHLSGVVALWSGRVVEAMELLERSAAGAAATSPEMAALALADAAFAATAAGECRHSLALAERACGLLGDVSDPTVRAPVLAIFSWALVLCGESRRARPIMTEAVGLASSLDPLSPPAALTLSALNLRLPSEDYEGALADALASAATAREAGSLYALPTPLCIAAGAAYRLGRWEGLEAICGEAIAAAQETDQWGPAALAAITRARLAAARGQEAETRADAETAMALASSAGVGSLAVYGHGVLGFLALGTGRVDAAIDHLEQAERGARETGLEEPTVVPWAPDLVEAYVRAGRVEPARCVLATLERQAELAATAGAAALAARSRGLLAEDDFDEHFSLALGHDDRAPMPFERARTLLAWGMRLHRARRRADARDRLRAAAEALERLGAAPWAQLARAEWRAAGGRRRTPLDDALTGQEERVARAAARGATTREIAAELFLSPKTVEFHLGRAYRKLGVRSRAELATALAAGGAAVSPTTGASSANEA